MVRAFQTFYKTIFDGIGSGHQPRCPLRLVKALVVQAVDLEETSHADHRRCLGAGRQVYLVGHCFTGIGPGIASGLVTVAGQVLDQPASAGDVEDLHPSADGQYGHVMLQGVMEQAQIQVVQPAVHYQASRWIGFLII